MKKEKIILDIKDPVKEVLNIMDDSILGYQIIFSDEDDKIVFVINREEE